eukprot:g972.t1
MSFTDPNLVESVVNELRSSFNTLETLSLSWRRKQLRALQEMVTSGREALMQAVREDLGKDKFGSYFIELNPIEREIQEALDHLEEWSADIPVEGDVVNLPSTQHIHPEPLGVVFIAGAWNFPLQLTLAPLIAAITAGNCVLVKTPSYKYSKNSALAMEKLADQFLDKRYIRFCGGSREIMAECLKQRFDKIFFTGGCSMGRRVARAAAEHLTPMVLELGGKSPVIVDTSANLTIAAKRIVWSTYLNSGQMCIRPDYLLVDRKVGKQLVDKMLECIETFYTTDPLNSEHFGKMVNDRQFDWAVERLAKDVQSKKCRVLPDNQRTEQRSGKGALSLKTERYIAPTILDFGTDKVAFQSSAAMTEEQFAPVLPVYYYDTLDEVAEMVKDQCQSGNKPLMTHVFTTRTGVWRRFEHDVQCGMFAVNDAVTHAGNGALPFGGVGKSGMGSYHGKFGFNTFSHFKTVLVKTNYLDLSARYPPYSEEKYAILAIVQQVRSRAQMRAIKFAFLILAVYLLRRFTGSNSLIRSILRTFLNWTSNLPLP